MAWILTYTQEHICDKGIRALLGGRRKCLLPEKQQQVPGFCVYRIWKGIISNYEQKLMWWWMPCKVAVFSLFSKELVSFIWFYIPLSLWFTPSKISPSTGFTKCDVENKWKQVKCCKIAIGFLRIQKKKTNTLFFSFLFLLLSVPSSLTSSLVLVLSLSYSRLPDLGCYIKSDPICFL